MGTSAVPRSAESDRRPTSPDPKRGQQRGGTRDELRHVDAEPTAVAVSSSGTPAKRLHGLVQTTRRPREHHERDEPAGAPREAEDRALSRAVRVDETGPDHAHCWLTIGRRDEGTDSAGRRPGVGVEQEDVAARREPDSMVGRGAEAAILGEIHDVDAGIGLADVGRRTVGRGRVDDVDRAAEVERALEAAVDLRPAVVGDDDDRELVQRVLSQLPALGRGSGGDGRLGIGLATAARRLGSAGLSVTHSVR